jgi:FkbM family methyltransferase
MFRALFHVYQKTPAPLRSLVVGLSTVPRLLAKPFVRDVRVGGCSMVLDSSDNAAFRYWNYRGEYEPRCTELLLRLISGTPGCYFLDIGANYGHYTLAVANIGRYGLVKRVFSFEPDPVCCHSFAQSSSRNRLGGLVEFSAKLVGDYDGTAPFLKSPRSSTSNRSFESADTSFNTRNNLPCITIDKFLSDQGIDVASNRFIFKMDIEGNELRAFRGMAKTLAHCAGYAVLFEYWPLGIMEAGIKPSDLREFITTMNPDSAYRETDSGFESCTLSEMFVDMEHLDARPDHKVTGQYVISRSIPTPPLS